MRLWQKNVLLAYAKGMRTTPRGQIIGVRGRPLKLCKGVYPSFHFVRAFKTRTRVPAHKFAAYCFFGERALHAPCVRHVNGKRRDLSRRNIRIGTYSDNEHDKPAYVRRRSAQIAARSTRQFQRASRVDARGKKRCSHCRRRKKASMFSPNRRALDGRVSWCKRCKAQLEIRRRKRWESK